MFNCNKIHENFRQKHFKGNGRGRIREWKERARLDIMSRGPEFLVTPLIFYCESARALTRDTLSFDVSFLENPANIRIKFILPETRFHKIHDSCYNMVLSVINFSQFFSKLKKRSSRRALTRDPVFWHIFSKKRTNIYYQKLQSRPKISDTDCLCLSLLVFTKLFSKIARSDARQTVAERELNAK